MRVMPVRYTDDPVRMRLFLEALGLRMTVASDSGGWIALEGSGGGVGLHEASSSSGRAMPGGADLSFESDEKLEHVAARLAAAGYRSDIVDEAFGRSLRVTDPDGVVLQVNETMTDTYGYTARPGAAL